MTETTTLPVPASPAALADRHAAQVHADLGASMAPATALAYERQWRRFSAWCDAHGYEALPASPATLCAYLSSRRAEGAAYNTIQQAKAAVVKEHAARGYPSPVDGAGGLVSQLLRGIRRNSGPGRQAPPVRWEEADAAADMAAADGLAGLRDAAVLAVMSDAMLRISEAAALDVEDIEAEAPMTLTIRRSKTDQAGEGVVLPLRRGTVKRVRKWMEAAGITAGALFRRIHRGGHVQAGRLTPPSIRQIIRRRAADAGVRGLDAGKSLRGREGQIGGHSLRVGSAQSFAEAGASLVEMQLAGRWRSPDMPGRYARGQLAERGALRKYRGQ